MLLHNAPLFQIYCGDAHDGILNPVYDVEATSSSLLTCGPYKKLKKLMHLEYLVFPRQVHGTDGLVVTRENIAEYTPFLKDADYVLTNLAHVGIGIMTADCLPVMCFDARTTAIGIAHAGWRSSVKRIVVRMIEHMQRIYATQPEHLQVFLGPSAKVCCYQVTGDFAEQLDSFPFAHQVMVQQDDGIYFNVPEFNRVLLESIGVRREAIHGEYNRCTMDEITFCSYRRQKESSGRQMTVIALK